MSSLKTTDDEAAANAVAPRVTLADIEAAIEHKYVRTASDCVNDDRYNLDIMTICILVMRNGFIVIGKSAPASPENFNPELGEKFAYEDAVRQLWPLMGYALRDKLHHGN